MENPTTSNNGQGRKYFQIFVIAIIGIIFVASIGYVGAYMVYAVPIDPEVSETIEAYEYKEEANWYLFSSDYNNENKAVVFFPHPRIDEKAYFYLSSQLQKKGYNVFLAKSFLHQPILSTNIVSKAKEAYPTQSEWFVGGHADGAHAVSKHVVKKSDSTEGAFYLGEAPEQGAIDTGLPILVIEGDLDLETVPIQVNQKNVTYYIIEDASNINFSYQKVDKNQPKAGITRKEQQDIAADRIDKFIQSQTKQI